MKLFINWSHSLKKILIVFLQIAILLKILLVIKEYEKIIYENRKNSEKKNNKRKEIIESFEGGKLVRDIPHMEMVYEVNQ